MLHPYGWPTARSDAGLVCDQHLKRLKYHSVLDSEVCVLPGCYNKRGACQTALVVTGWTVPDLRAFQTPPKLRNVVHCGRAAQSGLFALHGNDLFMDYFNKLKNWAPCILRKKNFGVVWFLNTAHAILLKYPSSGYDQHRKCFIGTFLFFLFKNLQKSTKFCTFAWPNSGQF